MAVNYNDERFKEVESEKKQALTENEQTYAGMIEDTDKYYQAQIDASKKWAETQTKNQQAQTDFAIEKIEQQKDQATKDYTKEQSGAYVDWQKESNRYGANAEELATGGLNNSGYGESSQVRMYNTYQNRVAMARESYNAAVLNYDNAIKDAQLQNNSILAEIAYNSLQQQLELSLQGFQYKNQLVLDKATKKATIENTYHARYQDVLSQINTENALAEQIRQYNQNYQLQLKQFKEEVRQYNEQMAEDKRRYNESQRASSGGSSGSLITKSSGGSGGSQVAKSSGGTSAKSKAETAGEKAYRDLMSGKYLTNNSTLSKLAAVTGGKNGAGTTQSGRTHSGGSQKIEVKTDYYKGSLNPDAKEYGTFDNGYQPKGISGHGTLSKTGDKLKFTTQTLAGKSKTVKQNIWKASDGTQWYWDGTKNAYVQLK